MELDKILTIEEESTTIDDLIKGFYSLINNPIAVIDENYKIVSHFSIDEKTLGETFYNTIKSGYWSIELINIINKELENKDYAYITFDNIKRLFIKLIDNNQHVIGYLVIIEFENKLKDIEPLIIKHLVKIITKHLIINVHHQNINNLNSLFTSLINNEFDNENIFLEKYHSLINSDKEFKLLIIYLNESNKKIYKNIEIYLTYLFIDSIIIFKEKYILVFINQNYNEEDINSFFFKYKLYGIISTPILNLFKANIIFDIEKKLLTYLMSYKNEYILYEESDYVFLSTIIATNNNILLLSLIHEDILEILKYDYTNDASLCSTLFNYLKNNHSLNECSKELFLHKNTITYRLNKIKDLINNNLDNVNLNLNYLHSLIIISYLKSINFNFSKYLNLTINNK